MTAASRFRDPVRKLYPNGKISYRLLNADGTEPAEDTTERMQRWVQA